MIDMSDFTFCIPCKIDTPARQENLNDTIDFLTKHIKTNILVGELDTIQKCKVSVSVQHLFFKDTKTYWDRTGLRNKLFQEVKTPYLVNHDMDIFTTLSAWERTAKICRSNKYSFVFPYNGICYYADRSFRKAILDTCASNQHLYHSSFKYTPAVIPGGSVACRRDHCLEFGGENENFRSWGWEDWERWVRWETLGYNWSRVSLPEAVIYHIAHPTPPDSSRANPYAVSNEALYKWIKTLSKEQLEEQINMWPWRKNFKL